MRKTLIFLATIFISFSLSAEQIVIYPTPSNIVYSNHNDDFTVCVKTPGGEWEDLFEYRVMVDLDNPQPASMVQFDFSGKVEMRVKVNNGIIHTARIRPTIKGIEPEIKGNIIYFTIEEPSKLSLEVNGDMLHNLHIFANPLETEIPNADDPNVIYFGEGIHNPKDVPGDVFRIPSNSTVYLAPGAIVRGKFVCDKVENVRFLGRGYIENPNRGFEITYSKNIEIDGITVINPDHYTVYGGEVDGLKIRNLKSFSCKGWSDGINLMSCSNVDIEDIFLRNSDDCIAIYAHRWSFYGDVRNYKIRKAILWSDVAHPINIGLHGDTKIEGNIIENLHFSDIDILEHDEDDREYQGCMAFSVTDHNLVQNVTFENIRIENIQEGQLFNIRVFFNDKYSTGPGRGVKNVKFKNITYNGYGEHPSVIEGYNDNYKVENISFENIVINGKRATSFGDANIKIGNFTKGITIK